ncbi:MAG: universal stress protein [Rhodobacteraceae bacterium]|nr:universal stress protein [Paracoccaceae bacterium]
MSVKFVVGYDGSAASRRAVEFALARAEEGGASIVIAHVLEWSPYTFLTPEELAERHGRREQEMERAKSALLEPLLGALGNEKTANVETVIKYGHIADTLCKIAEDSGADQLVIGRQGGTALAARVFGSVAGSLAQAAPVPCTIVP